MATKRVVTNARKIFLGTCVPSSKDNVAKVRVSSMTLDKHLNMYFNTHDFIYATNSEVKCKPGDTVLVRNLPERLTRLITHEVLEIIYPFGDVTDPITGKKVVAGQYRDQIKEMNQYAGELESAFDYDKAPARGTQENKRDFSHKDTYLKYHEDPDDPQPFAV